MEQVIDLKGLSAEEVVASRLKNGANITSSNSASPFWSILKGIVTEPLFFILVGTASIYFILGDYQEGVIMLIALLFISAISLFQENRSRNAVDSLKKLSSPHAKVIRAGLTTNINTEDLVVGDLVVVEDGDIVPADAKVLKSNDFSVNESLLTGESLPVSKDIRESNDRIYQGSTVMSGSCVARVEVVGRNTALGKIGLSIQEIDTTKTPLQFQIKSFIRSMVVFGLIAFLIVWGVNFYMSGDLLHGLLHGLTLAMSVLPEEIPVAFSTFMALGAYHLYKKGVIARSPHTVETLGAATVICVDKTGTITENRMQVSAIYDFSKDQGYDYTKQPFNFNAVLEYALWASETSPFDQMEKSIHSAYEEVAPEDKRKDFFFVHEYPLGGTPPIMTHVLSNKQGSSIIAVKGSVEGVLKQCSLSDDQKVNIEHKTMSFAAKGFRVLGVAKSDHDISDLPLTQQELKLDFLGLIAFYDPPKANMKDILYQFYKAGINVKMITGDYPATAISIANQIHFKNSSSILTGEEVMAMNQATLCQKVKEVDMYARMFPESKLRVIESLKQNGEVVAMTGDGVNDGPALKAAHIGVAMGLRGSEVAKSAASLILMDDDLIHMTDAIALGRRIYENLKKAIRYIISIHIPIILIVTLPLLLVWRFTDIFSPIHVIFLELIMGPTCSVVFENEPIEPDSMEKAPRKMVSSFFSFKELSFSIVQGFAITTACLGLGFYFMVNNHNETLVRTVIYTCLIFSNLFLTLANRSFYYPITKTIQYRNILIPIIIGISLIVLYLSIYVPAIQNIFEFEALDAIDLLLCFAIAFVGVMWIELYKLFYIRKRYNTIS